MKAARFQHFRNIDIILILGINPLFHFLKHLWGPKGIFANIFIGWKFHVLGDLGISIVALFVMAFKLPESVLILTG